MHVLLCGKGLYCPTNSLSKAKYCWKIGGESFSVFQLKVPKSLFLLWESFSVFHLNVPKSTYLFGERFSVFQLKVLQICVFIWGKF